MICKLASQQVWLHMVVSTATLLLLCSNIPLSACSHNQHQEATQEDVIHRGQIGHNDPNPSYINPPRTQPRQDPPGTRPIGGGYGGRLPQMNRDGEQVRDMAEFEEDRDSENAIMLESGLSREKLLEETLNEVKEDTFTSWAQSLVKIQGYTSADATSANKRGSQQANKEGKTRNTIEELVEKFEMKLINFSGNFSQLTKQKLKCVHQLGGLTSSTELARIIRRSGSCNLPKPCCDANDKYRTIDGSCNNLITQRQGMAQTPFRRLLPPFYEDNIQAPRGRQQRLKCLNDSSIGPFDPPTPSARLVSKEIVRDNRIDKEAPLTHMVMQWGQFLDHDLDLAPEGRHDGPCASCAIKDDCDPIKIPAGDTLRGSTGDGKCINFRRSTAVCETGTKFTPREQLNDLTSYLDGSQVYGSNKQIAEDLRKKCSNPRRCSFKGQLDVSSGKRLPIRRGSQCAPQSRCYIAGDVRVNEQPGLTALHTLFVREHNRIARKLSSLNSHWTSDKVYEETRKIVGAILQKITYEDYLPSLLGARASRLVLRPYRGYDSRVDASIPNAFATAAYRYGHSLVQPRFITYTTDRYERARGGKSSIRLRDSFFNIKVFERNGMEPILRGLITQQSLRTDESVSSVLTSQLFERPGSTAPGLDLAALNIQRGRDHGLPVYSAWKAYCKTVYPNLPDAVIANIKTLWKMYAVYGTPEVADLFVAGLSEKDIKGSILGPTFACIFGVTFSDLRDGDRFYYENTGVFTRAQLREIKHVTLSRVICDNTRVSRIQRNSFEYVRRVTRRVRCSQLPTMNLNRWKESRSWQQEDNDDIIDEYLYTDDDDDDGDSSEALVEALEDIETEW